MKKLKLIVLTLSLIPLILLLVTGCSSRMETPVTDADSTIVYPPKKADGILAKITLCRNVDKQTGKRTGAGTVFSIKEKGNIRAFVDIENRFFYGDRELMFHLDWMEADGNSFYLKRIDLPPGDSSTTINSSISISSDRRQPGEYILRVYLFRELIAEKKFELLPEGQNIPSKAEGITAKITLCRNVDKKTGDRIGDGTVFTIREKERVRAYVDIENRFACGDSVLMFHLDWIGANGNSFYKKQIDLSPDDTSSTINSSISVSPATRQPGEYILRIYLFSELIAEKKFELRSESQDAPSKGDLK